MVVGSNHSGGVPQRCQAIHAVNGSTASHARPQSSSPLVILSVRPRTAWVKKNNGQNSRMPMGSSSAAGSNASRLVFTASGVVSVAMARSPLQSLSIRVMVKPIRMLKKSTSVGR